MKENLKNNCVLFPPTDSNTLLYIHNSFQSLRKKANNFFSLSLLCENSHIQNFWITYLILTPCIFLYLINKISLIEENVETIFLFLWRVEESPPRSLMHQCLNWMNVLNSGDHCLDYLVYFLCFNQTRNCRNF